MSDFEEAQRGQLAQQVLDNPVFQSAYTLLESEFTRQWRDSRNTADREEIHAKLLLLDKVKSLVESVMRRGEIAASELARKKTLLERAGLRRAS